MSGMRCLALLAVVAAAGMSVVAGTRRLRETNVAEQVHVSFTGVASEYIIQWVTFEPVTADLVSEVQVGVASGQYTRTAAAAPWEFVEGRCDSARAMHEVLVTGVVPDQRIFYRVRTVTNAGGPGPWSAEFSFVPVRTEVTPARPLVFSIFGDMASPRNTGAGNPNSVYQLIRDTQAGIDDFVIHAGDIAYNVDDNCGEVGDEFMNAVQPFAANVPYMNHETDVLNSYLGYRARYHAQEVIGARSGTSDSQYYSWDQPLVHFAVIDTDAWIYPTEWSRMEPQWRWLQEDLAKVNRTQTPWVVVYGHRALYCNSDSPTECGTESAALRYGRLIGSGGPGQREFGLEQVFLDYGVDIYVAGHTHHYEREYPVQCEQVTDFGYTNPRAPVHILAGKAGINGQDSFLPDPWVWNAFRDVDYNMSFGRITIYNETHMLFQQHLATDGSILDGTLIVQENHGPFQRLPCDNK